MPEALRRWWGGLRRGDRRLVVLFGAIVLATLPAYAAGLLLLLLRSEPPSAAAPPAATPSVPSPAPTLADFWDGRAAWRLDVPDVGLPLGESDTLVGPDGQLWSYLHASYESAGIRDRWGVPVPFPGCVTLWKSTDGGRHFTLVAPTCLIDCAAQPCDAARDHV